MRSRKKNSNFEKVYGMSAPCKHCHQLIRKCGIQKIKYIDGDGKIISVRTNRYKINHVSSGIRLFNKKLLIQNKDK